MSSILLACMAKMGIAFANGPLPLALGLVISGELLFQGVATVYIINSTSLRQACVPQELRGRAAAVVRVLSWGVGSCGALLGGILAQGSDLRTTMVVAALGTLSALVCIVLSPVRRVQSLA